MGVREQYLTILAEDGRRVANRFALASVGKGAERDLSTFYACYGSERGLPEDERSRPGNSANAFDPCGWFAFYENHPYNERSISYQRTKGASAYWLDQLVKARASWGKWVTHFLYKSLICDELNEVYDAIADDQGEFVTVEDGATLCAWFVGWRGWAAWSASVSDDDIATLGEVFAWVRGEEQEPHRWPDPGTPQAAALRSKLPSANRQKQENKQ